MTATETQKSLVLEREFPHPPDRVWRALTQPHLLADWLMPGDFRADPGHEFQFRGDWGAVDCRVIESDPPRALAYRWAALGLESVVRWTLTAAGSPPGAATHLRMEQSGFRSDQAQAYGGARIGWTRMLEALDAVLARID